MPFSSKQGKAVTAEWLKDSKAKSVLDVGAGSGTYRKLANKVGALQDAIWIALEVWDPYVEKFGLRSLYHSVIVEDVRYLKRTDFDLVIFGDVLEHMSKEEAFEVLEHFSNSYRIVSVPTVHYPQGEHEGNPYERHVEEHWKAEWIPERFKNELSAMRFDKDITVYLLCPRNR
jgi:cyclopropane fatty-acyl-phospholipid synthase-like methyltransferase